MIKEGQQKKDYIGSTMSLISKQEIRYVGTLVMINSTEQTLMLENVKSYGSEGRRKGIGEEIPPSQTTYERIVFKASELKDFYVIKSPENEFKDPAILATEANKPEEKKAEEKKMEESKSEIKPWSQPAPFARKEGEGLIPWQAEDGNESEGIVRQPRYYAPRGTPYITQGSYEKREVQEVKEKFQEDFDFEGMNKKFTKLFTEKEASVEANQKYDKGKSFYDGLSKGKEEKTEALFDRSKQREIDATTFELEGQDYGRGGYYPRYRSRGYRRGSGYGGRRGDGYRGRGDGYIGRGDGYRGRGDNYRGRYRRRAEY